MGNKPNETSTTYIKKEVTWKERVWWDQVHPTKIRKTKNCKCKFTECNLLTNEELEAACKKYYKIGDSDSQKFNLLQNIKDCPKNVTRLKIKESQTRKRDETEGLKESIS